MRVILLVLLVASFAGCISDANDAGSNSLAFDTGAPETEAHELEVSHSGYLRAGAAVLGLSPASVREDRWAYYDGHGVLDEVNITITWDAMSLGTQEMILGITEGDDSHYVVGPSPLTLTLEPGWKASEYGIWAWFSNEQPVSLSAEQPFEVTGALTFTTEMDEEEDEHNHGDCPGAC